MADGQTIILRLTIADPVAGTAYSLQDKAGKPVDAKVAGNGPLSFDVAVRLADGPRFLGPYVRSEGPQRRFIYIAIGQQAGEAAASVSRRAKIDIHTLDPELLRQARAGRVLEAVLPGRDAAGLPACATQRPIAGWRVH